MAAISAAIAAALEIVKLAKDLFVLYRRARREGWLSEATIVLEKVKTAKTDDERRELVRELAKIGIFPRG